METENFDLFGDPVRLPNGRRGRPKHVPTQKIRNKVMMLLAMGWGKPEVAAGIGVSLPTLRRYYFSELKRQQDQRLRLDAWRMEKLIDQVDEGNVSAIRELDRQIDRADKKGLSDILANGKDNPTDENIGKKEHRRREANSITDGSDATWDGLLNPMDHN